MKYTTAVLALATAAKAQDLSVFPPCAIPCIAQAVSTSTTCFLLDFACVCRNMDAVKASATSCVIEKCGADVALNQVLPATEKFCSQVLGPAASSTSSSVSSSTTSSSSTSSAASTSTDASKPNSSSSADSSLAKPTPTGGSSNSTSSTASSKPTSSAHTAGAATVHGAVVGTFGMLILGFAAAL
ncbi:CFEM-domain-containing protein [Parathielavia appendiculata]|uniref:CFEM-domain-containing protein n=1 Tax=Parathielavia appendiculata TaxID=2587402 RepID=A0AAN6UAH9_9PEZI|nr:CFEM-domain-containing protein [Parathielavia appendiculata]